MALVPIRIDRTSKPPLGTPLRSDGHWSVQGLVGAWAFNEGAGKTIINTVNGGTFTADPADVRWTASGLDFSIGTAGVAGVVHSAPNRGLSLLIKGNFQYRYSFAHVLFAQADDRYVGFETDSDGRLWPSMTYGNHTVCITTDGSTQKRYGDGLLIDSWESYAQSVADAQVYIGTNSSRSASFNGSLHIALIHNRVLSPAQVASLSESPWQIYEPEIVWIEVPDGTGGTTYTDTLTALAESYAGITDVATCVDAATALITAGVDADSAVTMTEAVLSTAQAADTVSDTMQRVESVLANIQAADTVQDAVAIVESMMTSATESGGVADFTSRITSENVTSISDTIITVADVQAMGEQVLASASVTVTTADAVTAGESVTTVTSASATVQDVVVMLESVYSQLEAQATVTDEQTSGVAENLLTSATAIAGVTDLQLMVSTITTIATAGASIGEIASYLESVVSAATAGVSVTDAIVGPLRRIYALSVSVRDPLALSVSVRDPLSLNIAVSPW